MNRTLRWGCLLAALLLPAGCGGSSASDAGRTAPAATPSPVTLRIMLPGDRAADYDLVLKEAQRRLAGTLNVSLDIKFVPWNDFGRVSQVALASGEEIDLVFDAPWLHLSEMISSGYYEPLDVLLEKYGETILTKRPRPMWEANRYGGKIMAIPLGVSYAMGHSYFVRKDLREKLGVPPIQSYEELIRFAYLLKQKEPDVVPLIAAGNTSQQLYSQAAFRHYDDVQNQIRPTQALGSSLMLYYQRNDGKVHNLFREKDSPVRDWIREARRLYVDGVMHPNVLGIKDFQDPGFSGEAAIFPAGSFSVDEGNQEKLKRHAAGGELESVTFYQDIPKANLSNFAQWNFIAVPVTSKHKEEAIQFLNWANEKDNYDLLAYGLPGVHWEPVGTDRYRTLKSGYQQFPYVWLWNPDDDRVPATDDRTEALDWFIRRAEHFTPDLLTGFQFDGTPVQNELNAYARIEAEYYTPLFNGVLDPEEAMPRFEAEAGALLEAIGTELQRQIDAFLRNKRR
ncbi:ABC transporter substrate-binding protein [Paenibacillus elgii]|uniref:ABC transporter substrate-binding protein n=1 Tax=Paenibacillus elgii TaxID=189691 RepID=A0A2T6G014_9BACL|nr:extracellular solute-binding protein [Paenibacillus elgii]PUA37499.1 ABC transporter substrate-binding protein [Paenibacillus elgii]